jgi:Protein of Unknown function (DUF2784)
VIFRILADAVVALHLAVVAFIVAGGLLAWRRRRLALVHLPFAAWGVAIEIGGWTCPLTPLENWLRRLGGEAGYRGGFVEHYVLPVLYPAMGPHTALALAALVLTVNTLVYVPLLTRGIRARARARARGGARQGTRTSVSTR